MRISAHPVRSGTTNTVFSFSDTSTGLPRSWSWNFGDGTPTSTEQILHIDTLLLALTRVTDSDQCRFQADTETKSAYITGNLDRQQNHSPRDLPHEWGNSHGKVLNGMSGSYDGDPGGENNKWLNGAYIGLSSGQATSR